MPNNLFCMSSSLLFLFLEFHSSSTYFLERTQRTPKFKMWLMTLISTLSSYASAPLDTRKLQARLRERDSKLSIRITAQWGSTNGSWGSVGTSQSLSQLSCRSAWLATSNQHRGLGFPV